jgi:hypothetical protein
MGKLVRAYGGPVKVNPTDALMQELYRTQGHVLWLAEQVTNNAPDELARAFWEYRRSTEVPSGFKETVETHADHGYAGVWLDLYMKERAHLAKICQIAITLDLDTRRLQLDEKMAAVFAAAVTGLCQDLGLDPASPPVREKIYTRMAQAGAFLQLEVES